MGLLDPAVIIGIAAVITFYAMGEHDSRARVSTWLAPFWALLSAVLTFAAIKGPGGGVVAVIVAQLGLLIGIGVVRVLRDN